MPKFSANLTLLFAEVPFLERFAEAARAGFAGIEYQLAYEFDKADIKEALHQTGLELVLHNLPAGNWGAGDRGVAADPTRIGEFKDGVEQAIEHATFLGCKRLNCLAGIPAAGTEPAAARTTLIDNLRHAAAQCAKHDIQLLTEPVNTRDIPGFFLSRFDQALEIISEVGAPNLSVQYDIYHMQIMHGDLAHTIQSNLDRIGHIQFADTPGRHEPGTGEINFPFLFEHLDRIEYAGWVGAEYFPGGATTDGLNWFAPSRSNA